VEPSLEEGVQHNVSNYEKPSGCGRRTSGRVPESVRPFENFDGRSAFSTWLTRIAINSALMILRKKRTHPETSIEWTTNDDTWREWEVADKGANIEEHYEKRESEWRLEQAIDR
jgi:DNA-directed RNA polymerase specialized sigma24 family protein